jgi:hypothetical protein
MTGLKEQDYEKKTNLIFNAYGTGDTGRPQDSDAAGYKTTATNR